MRDAGDIAVGRAGVEDLDALTPLFHDYRGSYSELGDLEHEREYLHDRLTRGESVVFVAWIGGEPAGFVQLYPTFSSLAMCSKWILNDVYVAEPFRRRHVAPALVQRAVEFVRETGAGRFDLKTGKDNTSVQKFYEALGWERDTKFYTYSFPFE